MVCYFPGLHPWSCFPGLCDSHDTAHFTFRRPTAIGVMRVQSEGVHLSLGDCWWQLGPGELLNQTTDKGIMVTMHLGSTPAGIFDSMLLDLSIH